MYAFDLELNIPFADALVKVVEALKSEQFGIVSEVDVQALMQGKLGLEFTPYRILGACAAPLARRALEAAPDAGTLLPCNVVVRESGTKVVVSFMDPRMVFALSDNEAFCAVAEEAYEKLRTVMHHLQGDA
jgi:uncharacterized protein (DUF302 family)